MLHQLPMALVVLAPRLEGVDSVRLAPCKTLRLYRCASPHFFAAVQPLCNGLSGMMQTVLQNVATPFERPLCASWIRLSAGLFPCQWVSAWPRSCCPLRHFTAMPQPHPRRQPALRRVQSYPDQAHAEPFRRKPGRARPAPLPGVQGHAQRRRLPGLHTQVSNIERFRKTGRKLRYNHAIVTMR